MQPELPQSPETKRSIEPCPSFTDGADFSVRALGTRGGGSTTPAPIAKQKSFQQDEDYLRAIIEDSSDCIKIVGWEGTLRDINQAGLDMVGAKTSAEVLGKSIYDIIAPEDRERFRQMNERVCRGSRERLSFQIIGLDGTRRFMETRGAPLRDPRTGEMQQVAVTRDVTEQRLAENALRASEERFRTVADNICQLAWTAEPSGLRTWFNQRWYDYSGTTFEQVKGTGWEMLHHPEHLGRVKEKQKECFKHGLDWEDTFPLKGKDGTFRWFLSRAVPIRNGEGTIVCWFGTNTDVTELREAREELARYTSNLEQRVNERTASLQEALKQMEEFGYTISHDLRSPVRVMQGYAAAALEDYGNSLDARGRDYLERIIRGGERLDRLIHDVLTYSRVGRYEIQLQPVGLGKLVAEVILQYPEMRPPHAEIKVRGSLHTVLAHEPALNQAISNLLSNSVKFIAHGSTAVVNVWSELRESTVRLWIEDNGIGIKPEHQSRLFGVFERLHLDKRYEGTGIGLAIVRKAIDRMGGKVGVVSDGFTGSSFWIELPPAPTQPMEMPAALAARLREHPGV